VKSKKSKILESSNKTGEKQDRGREGKRSVGLANF